MSSNKAKEDEDSRQISEKDTDGGLSALASETATVTATTSGNNNRIDSPLLEAQQRHLAGRNASETSISEDSLKKALKVAPSGCRLELTGAFATPSTSELGNSSTATELSIISQPIVIASSLASADPVLAPSYQQHQHQQQHLLPSIAGTSQAAGARHPQATVSTNWLMLQKAQQARSGVRQRMSQASDQLGYSLRQLYASASSIAADLPPPAYHNIPGTVPYYHGRSNGPPPSYEDVVNPYAGPPTYQSLFGQMLEARKKSRGLLDLLRRLLIVSTLGCTLIIALMILIPFTMIIIGALYMDQCRVEHIPAFLLVGGCVWASKNIIHCYVQCQQPDPLEAYEDLESATRSAPSSGIDQQQSTITSPVTSTNGNEQQQQQQQLAQPNANRTHNRRQRLRSAICESLLNCVLFGWFVAGCVIVLRNYEPDFEDTSSERYCNKTVYMYTFWLITSTMIMFGLFVGCICCLMVSSAVASRQEEDLS